MSTPATKIASRRSFADLTREHFGESLTMDEAFARLAVLDESASPTLSIESAALWVGSIGYERFKVNTDFAQRLREVGVERLIDVRELPISRRRGYAKTALGQVMAAFDIEYLHIRALGNPKPFRDLYKGGQANEGRVRYRRYLLDQQRDALDALVTILQAKPSALMCVEHDPTTCHRTVIVDSLRQELGLELEVAEIT